VLTAVVVVGARWVLWARARLIASRRGTGWVWLRPAAGPCEARPRMGIDGAAGLWLDGHTSPARYGGDPTARLARTRTLALGRE
jgi:hypothetical protein